MSNAAAMVDPTQEHEGGRRAEQTGGRLMTADGRELPLKHASVEAEAGGGLARVILSQRFYNPHEEPLRVTYLLPLPSDGVVSGFSFFIGDERVVGEVDTRSEARERFEHALVQGKTTALLEQQRSSLFNQEVGNIPPKTEIVAEIVVDQRLRWLDEGSWEWRFPTVVGPRYMGAPGRVPDAASQIVPISERELPTRMSLSMTISDELANGASVESPSHSVRSTKARGALDVAFEGDGGIRLDRDIVVHWRVARQEVGLSVALARPADPNHGDSAYGLLTIVPPEADANVEPMPRDLIFVIDASGSMHGRPIQQATRVASAMIDTLGPRDQIEMIAFANRPERWR